MKYRLKKKRFKKNILAWTYVVFDFDNERKRKEYVNHVFKDYQDRMSLWNTKCYKGTACLFCQK